MYKHKSMYVYRDSCAHMHHMLVLCFFVFVFGHWLHISLIKHYTVTHLVLTRAKGRSQLKGRVNTAVSNCVPSMKKEKKNPMRGNFLTTQFVMVFSSIKMTGWTSGCFTMPNHPRELPSISRENTHH